jgi:hypothetical protein
MGIFSRLFSGSKRESKPVAKAEPVKPVKTEASILNDPNFQYTLNDLRPYWRWMTLAGGLDPCIPPMLSSESGGKLTLKKKGYDLWTRNLKNYYSESSWSEQEKALEQFSKDLFGDYAEEMKKIVAMDYIADHLIELDDNGRQRECESDFILTYTTVTQLKTYEVISLLRRELQKNTDPMIK